MTTIFALNHSSAVVCYHEWQWFSFLRFLNPQFILLPVPKEEKILILSLFRHPRVSQTGCLAWITAQNWLLNFTGLDAAHCQDDAVAKHKPACLRSVHTSTQIDTLSTDYKHLETGQLSTGRKKAWQLLTRPNFTSLDNSKLYARHRMHRMHCRFSSKPTGHSMHLDRSENPQRIRSSTMASCSCHVLCSRLLLHVGAQYWAISLAGSCAELQFHALRNLPACWGWRCL